MSKYEDEIDEDTRIISNMVRVAYVDGFEAAKIYLDENLRRQGFLNASLILNVLSRFALDLSVAEDQKVREEYQKKLRNE